MNPVRLFSFLFPAEIMKADPPASSSGKYNPSDTNLAFPVLRVSATTAHSSPGSMISSIKILGESIEEVKAELIEMKSPLYGSD